MLRKNYKIKIRDKADYNRLIHSHIPTTKLSLKTIFFANNTEAILEDETITINSRLNISIVTICLSALILCVSYLLFESFENLYAAFIYVSLVFIAIYYIIRLEHESIECQILRKLY